MNIELFHHVACTTISICYVAMLKHILVCSFFCSSGAVAKNLQEFLPRLDWPINMKMFHFQRINLKNSADIWLFSYIVLIICPRRAVNFLLLPPTRKERLQSFKTSEMVYEVIESPVRYIFIIWVHYGVLVYSRSIACSPLSPLTEF